MHQKPIYHSMNSHLKILQHNVPENRVMTPLFAHHRISEFTVFAVQEPWRNPHMHTTHNPSNFSFHSFYPPSANASVCFFVNKSLNPSSYSASFPTPKHGYLCMKSSVDGAKDMMIHNLYLTGNLSLSSSEIQPPDDPLSVETHKIFSHFSAALSDTSTHHVLLGDFNIHHPSWGGASVRPDCSSQLLLSLDELHDLSLLLPSETVAFKWHNALSTIDLVFTSSSLLHFLTGCCLRKNLYHGSDHYPIERSYRFSPHVSLHVPKPL